MRYFRILDAFYDRLGGLVLGGLLHRLQVHHALHEAELTGELEDRIRRHRAAGNEAAAELLSGAIAQQNGDPAADGVRLANLLLSDRYVEDEPSGKEFDAPALPDLKKPRHGRSKGSRRKRPAQSEIRSAR